MHSNKTAAIDYRLMQKLTNKILNMPSFKKQGKRGTKKDTEHIFFLFSHRSDGVY